MTDWNYLFFFLFGMIVGAGFVIGIWMLIRTGKHTRMQRQASFWRKVAGNYEKTLFPESSDPAYTSLEDMHAQNLKRTD